MKENFKKHPPKEITNKTERESSNRSSTRLALKFIGRGTWDISCLTGFEVFFEQRQVSKSFIVP